MYLLFIYYNFIFWMWQPNTFANKTQATALYTYVSFEYVITTVKPNTGTQQHSIIPKHNKG